MTRPVRTAARIALDSILAYAESVKPGAAILLSREVRSLHSAGESRVPAIDVPLLLAKAAALLDEPRLGVMLGSSANPQRHGLLAYLASTSETLGEVWRQLCRYIGLLNEGMELLVLPAGDEMAIGLSPDPALPASEGRRQLLSLASVTIVRASHDLTGGKARPLRVELACPAPAEPTFWSAAYGAPVVFAAPSSRIVFSAADAALPIVSADSMLAGILSKHAEAVLSQLGNPSTWSGRVKALIFENLGKSPCGLAPAAKTLLVSERTLQRRLREEGTSFEALHDEARHSLALAYLRDRRLGIAEVAWLLGYAELAAFYRAFKRWTGVTPLEHRNMDPTGAS